MRNMAQEYHVNEKTIRKILRHVEEIKQRISSTDIKTCLTTFRVKKLIFEKLKKCLFQWIEATRRMKLKILPTIVIFKAKQIALTINIKEENFKASCGWYEKFRKCWRLKSVILLHDADVDVYKENPELFGECDQTETGLFY